MQTKTIILPESLTAENSRVLLQNCRKALQRGPLLLDGKSLKYMDYSGDAFFALLADTSEKSGYKLTLAHFNDDIKFHLQHLKKPKIPPKNKVNQNFLERLGENTILVARSVAKIFVLLNTCIYWSLYGHFDKGKSKFGGTAKQINRLGAEAMGICFLMVALICFTMALQSSFMLKAVGGGSYLASGLGYLIFAEISPLLTTIILAGRSGSSIAAEIANMSVCEEVKAIKAMAISPVQYLVVPRFIAMTICTPILSFCAGIAGCLAGFLIAFFFFDISFANYFQEIRDGIPPILFLKSTVKAVVFGWLITMISCHKGLTAVGGADAVGHATTSSVVISISSIIVAECSSSCVRLFHSILNYTSTFVTLASSNVRKSFNSIFVASHNGVLKSSLKRAAF